MTVSFPEPEEIPPGAWDQRDRKEIRDLIIMAHWPMLTRVVGRLRQNLPPHVRVDEDDLRSYGLIGMYKALDRYDPSLGHPFDKFASNFVRGAVLDELRSMDWAPRSLRKRQKDLDRVTRKLTAELGRSPGDEELAEELCWTVHDISITRKQVDTAWFRSIDFTKAADEDNRNLHRVVSETEHGTEDIAIPMMAAPEEDSASVLNEKLIRYIDATFTTQKKAVVVFCYFYGKRLSEVAWLLGLNEQKVSALHQEALGAILEKMRGLLDT